MLSKAYCDTYLYIPHRSHFITIFFCCQICRYQVIKTWLYSEYSQSNQITPCKQHDDVIKWKNAPRYWPFVRGIHRSPMNFPHKGQWRGSLMLSVICAWIKDWVNNREGCDLRRHHVNYDVIVMKRSSLPVSQFSPVKPSAQKHSYPASLSVQLASFRHAGPPSSAGGFVHSFKFISAITD